MERGGVGGYLLSQSATGEIIFCLLPYKSEDLVYRWLVVNGYFSQIVQWCLRFYANIMDKHVFLLQEHSIQFMFGPYKGVVLFYKTLMYWHKMKLLICNVSPSPHFSKTKEKKKYKPFIFLFKMSCGVQTCAGFVVDEKPHR